MANWINLLPHRDQLPVGFRFYPTDEELITHYLKNKALGNESLVEYIPQIETYNYDPSDLPGLLNDHTGFEKWFFFSALDFRNSNSHRSNRTTATGFWKSTGNDRKILARGTNECIGTKKTLVFHRGRAARGNRTNWVIHEYRLPSDTSFANSSPFVICRLKKKSDKNVSKFDEPNGFVNSTSENVGTAKGIQEIQSNFQGLVYDNSHLQSSPLRHFTGQPALPDVQPVNASDGVKPSIQPHATQNYFNAFELLQQCYSPQPPALPDFQPINASDGGVNRQSIQPEATENYFNPSELLNSDFHPLYASDEYNDDATSKMPDSMDFQLANGNDGEFNNQLLRPGPSESEINLANYLNSTLENENNDEATSTIYIDSLDNEELSRVSFELQFEGFCSASDNNKTFTLQNYCIPPRCYRPSSSAMQNMQTINKSSRSPLPVKRIQYEEKEICPPHMLQRSSCGSVVSTRNVSSYIITTKHIQHKSSHPLVFVAKTFLGIILFVVLAQEVLRY